MNLQQWGYYNEAPCQATEGVLMLLAKHVEATERRVYELSTQLEPAPPHETCSEGYSSYEYLYGIGMPEQVNYGSDWYGDTYIPEQQPLHEKESRLEEILITFIQTTEDRFEAIESVLDSQEDSLHRMQHQLDLLTEIISSQVQESLPSSVEENPAVIPSNEIVLSSENSEWNEQVAGIPLEKWSDSRDVHELKVFFPTTKEKDTQSPLTRIPFELASSKPNVGEPWPFTTKCKLFKTCNHRLKQILPGSTSSQRR